MNKITKFFACLTPKERGQVEDVLKKIQAKNLVNLDVKKLAGMNGVFRVRTGSIRIIFSKDEGAVRIVAIDRRSEDTYKRR